MFDDVLYLRLKLMTMELYIQSTKKNDAEPEVYKPVKYFIIHQHLVSRFSEQSF